MLEEVKVMMDEQTKLVLGRLQEAFEDLLSPLRSLNGAAVTGSPDAAHKVAEGLKRLSEDMEDSADAISRKLADIAQSQESLYAKLANVISMQAAMAEKLDKVVAGFDVLLRPRIEVSVAQTTTKAKVAAKSKAKTAELSTKTTRQVKQVRSAKVSKDKKQTKKSMARDKKR